MTTFPLSPTPAAYTEVNPTTRTGIWYVGGSPTFLLKKAVTGTWTVRDYWGNIITTGATQAGTTLTITAPVGGWQPGWYRVYLTGSVDDAEFGYSLGACCFVILRDDPRFPPNPARGTYGYNDNNEYRDICAKGVLGIGTDRLLIYDAAGTSELVPINAGIATSAIYWHAGAYTDAARPRELFVNFPNQTWDVMSLAGGQLRVYCKTGALNGANVTVAVAAGTTSGKKITIVNGAATEVFDNVTNTADAAITALATSTLVACFGSGSNTLSNQSATAIGNTYFNGVKAYVAAFWPSVKYYEGPSNEPDIKSREVVHHMMLFQAAVHAGNASAKAIGPCPVQIKADDWTTFLTNGGGAYCDEISFHDYNSINGNIAQGRTSLSEFKAVLARFGQDGKRLWRTENGTFTAVAGVFHPRRSRWRIMWRLLWEQYGLPRERDNLWYTRSHGFWGFPSWWLNEDGSLSPEAVLMRVLAEETFGQTHAETYTFGQFADWCLLASRYHSSAGDTVVIVANSAMDNNTCAFTVTGAATTLTVVDGFGNTSTVNITAGIATIPIADIPTYVRVPTGVTLTPYRFRDWPTVSAPKWSASYPNPPVVASTALPPPLMADGQLAPANAAGWGASMFGAVPSTVDLMWAGQVRADRIVIFCGDVFSSRSTLLDFDIQTSDDGTTWTTRHTVTRTGATSFKHGTNSTNFGCQRETFWDEQWIFDCKLNTPVTFTYLRLNVRSCSYGGEPDLACISGIGQGWAQELCIQEIVVLCDDNARPHVLI